MTGERITPTLMIAALMLAAGWLVISTPVATEDYTGSGDWVITEPTYLNDTTLEVAGNIYIENGGALYLDNATVIVKGPSPSEVYTLQVRNGGLLEAVGSNITRGTGGYFYVAVDAGGSMVLENSAIYGVGEPLDPEGDFRNSHAGVFINSKSASINNSTISGDVTGIAILNGSASVTNCSIEAKYLAVYIQNSTGTLLEGNDIKTGMTGIDLSRTTFTSILNNQFTYPGWTLGISADFSSDVNISGNLFYNSPETAYKSTGIQSYGLSGNITSNNFTGLVLGIAANHKDTELRIAGNILDLMEEGLSISSEATVTVEDNHIRGESDLLGRGVKCNHAEVHLDNNTVENWATGVSFASCSGNMTRNTITKNRYYGIEIAFGSYSDQYPVTIKDNIITHVSEGMGIYSSDSHAHIEGNLISDSVWGVYAYWNWNSQLINNTIINNSKIGVVTGAKSSWDAMESNRIYNNSWGLTYISEEPTDNALSNNSFQGPSGEKNRDGLLQAQFGLTVQVKSKSGISFFVSEFNLTDGVNKYVAPQNAMGAFDFDELIAYSIFNNGTRINATYIAQASWIGSLGTVSNRIEIIPTQPANYIKNLTLDPGPDFSIKSITATPVNYGNIMTIDVTVHNMGGLTVTDVPVNLYVDGFVKGNLTISSIDANGNATATFEWVVDKGGTLEISATVDPMRTMENDFYLFDFTNNNKNTTVTVSGGPVAAADTDTSIPQGGLLLVVVLEVLIILNLLGRLKTQDD